MQTTCKIVSVKNTVKMASSVDEDGVVSKGKREMTAKIEFLVTLASLMAVSQQM